MYPIFYTLKTILNCYKNVFGVVSLVVVTPQPFSPLSCLLVTRAVYDFWRVSGFMTCGVWVMLWRVTGDVWR